MAHSATAGFYRRNAVIRVRPISKLPRFTLTLYLDDGRIEMDTNAVERAMRPIKLNAKNALFAGCDEGAKNGALLASLIETCKLNGVSAELWLADVLAKLVNDWPAARLDGLLPWASTYTMHAQDPRLAA